MFFFSNRLGCLGSLMLSALFTVTLVLALRALQYRALNDAVCGRRAGLRTVRPIDATSSADVIPRWRH